MLGIILTLVAPLYAFAMRAKLRRQQATENTDEISQNETDIEEMNQRLTEIEFELSLVKNDLQVIHDNLREHNHCGSSLCRWCDGDPGDDD
jgi:predicted nuclease with TOPRIM domain